MALFYGNQQSKITSDIVPADIVRILRHFAPLTSDLFALSNPFRVRFNLSPIADRRSLGSRKQRDRASSRGFTLLELLVVVGIIGLLLVLMAPAFTYIKGGTDVTSAAYTIKGVLDTARTYAKANNTYVWVGFYEEDVSQSSTTPTATPGIGRIVMSIVASKDGTMLYPSPLTSLVTLPSASLFQVGKLTKLDNMHLKTFSDPTSIPADGFNTRPTPGTPPNDLTARIGNDATDPASAVAPANPTLQFTYPLGGTQYTFAKIIQFSPRGEGVIDNNNYTAKTVSEIGVEPTHGATVPASIPANVVAVQFSGLGGAVKIYQR